MDDCILYEIPSRIAVGITFKPENLQSEGKQPGEKPIAKQARPETPKSRGVEMAEIMLDIAQNLSDVDMISAAIQPQGKQATSTRNPIPWNRRRR